MHLKVVITKGEDGLYVVTIPSLPGGITQGKTIKEVKENITEAISLYLEPDEDIIPDPILYFCFSAQVLANRVPGYTHLTGHTGIRAIKAV
jgi:predicted RNase H-like HicB family nuclease